MDAGDAFLGTQNLFPIEQKKPYMNVDFEIDVVICVVT